MNRIEALRILGLNDSASKDDIKKRFRDLSKEKHPDKNKNPNAEEEYKKLSSAYTYLQNPPPENKQPFWPSQGFGGFNIDLGDLFGGRSRSIYKPKPINVSIPLSFNESVLGCKKNIVFDRSIPCSHCKGLGYKPCASCGGNGFVNNIRRQANFMVESRSPCVSCNSKGHFGEVCEECNGKKLKDNHVDIEVSIPGGVHDGQTIRLQGAGNAVADENGISQGDVLIKANVENNTNMRIIGSDVISNIEISLCDALKGINKKVKTVKGDLTMKVRPGVKHKDQVKLSGYGVGGIGNHIFNLEVKYPKDINKLIEFLEKDKDK